MIRFLIKVWICFFVSTLAFVSVTSVFIIFRGRENNSIKEIVYKQFDYVMSIIASQGICCYKKYL